ncbi:MAG: 4-hydroxy-tetrahydrodipicolinate reductase [Synergistales bacterium]|nr:4-hydroxy-tetrahydrodipicolinate reductase [Synergistales bacterium]
MSGKRLFVSGATGNVGKHLVRTIAADEKTELVGGFCAEYDLDLGDAAGIGTLGIKGVQDLEEGLRETAPDMVIDFTSANIVMDNLKVYAARGVDAVIGTTGFDAEMMEQACTMAGDADVRWAIISNFGPGINLVLEFLHKARQYYPYVSVVDRHPARMANAPSGTAVSLAQAAAPDTPGEHRSSEVLPGVLGATEQGVQILAQRLPYPGPYSEHEITLAREDETIRINVQDFSSAVYMDGVMEAVAKLPGFPGGTVVTSLDELDRS